MHQEIVENFVYRGFSFPVLLPIAIFKVNDRGTKLLDVNIEELADRVAWSLLTYSYAFTGGQIYFIRKYMEMSPHEMAQLLDVSEGTIRGWEGNSLEATQLNREQRMAIIKGLKESYFAKKERWIEKAMEHQENWDKADSQVMDIKVLYYK